MLRTVDAKEREREKSEKSEKSPTVDCAQTADHNHQCTFFRLNRLFRTFQELERRCPDHVEHERWQQAVEDGRRFLAAWNDQSEALGWTARDLFGLHTVPDRPSVSYRRLSRYDATGLVWLLQGGEVVALTEDTAAIRLPSGSVNTYRKLNKPALGPVGDSLDDFR